jgi:membrane protein DedA with SNARE-associated domain
MGHLGITEAIQFIERDGYALLFFWVLAEQGALPVPSAPLLIAVGALAHAGRLSAWAAIACCVAGALVADSVWFHFGRSRGKGVLQFLCRISLEPDSCVRKTQNAFLKHGLKTLLIAKFIPGLNAVAAPLAGDARIGIFRFLAVDAIGVVIWSAAYIGAGYIFSSQLELALAYAERLGSGFMIVVFGAAAAWILWKFIQRQRFLGRLEVARITPQELLDRVDAGADPYVVDLRSGPEKKLSFLDGAIRIAVEDLTTDAQKIPRDREIILVCS